MGDEKHAQYRDTASGSDEQHELSTSRAGVLEMYN